MVAGRTRFAGYLAGLAEAGRTPDPRLSGDGDFSQDSGEAAMREILLARCPEVDGVFCANDLMAAGALRALREPAGRCPPTCPWSASTTRRWRCPRTRR